MVPGDVPPPTVVRPGDVDGATVTAQGVRNPRSRAAAPAGDYRYGVVVGHARLPRVRR